MKIYNITFSGWPGVETALKSMSKAVAQNIYGSEIENLSFEASRIDFNLIRKIKQEPPDYIFIGGWDSNVKLLIQNVVKPKTKIILLWCSPITQTDMGNEISRFIEVWNFLNSGFIDYLGILFENDYNFLSKINDKVIYTPTYMDFMELNSVKPDIAISSENFLNTNLFCAPCSRKNIFTQIIALSNFKDKIKLHVNYTPSQSNVSHYISAGETFIGENFHNHLWMNRNQYLSKVKSMDFGMQITLSESFNYTAAEHMYMEIPVILSKLGPLGKNIPKDLNFLIVPEHDNLSQICSIIEHLISDKKALKEYGLLCKEYIKIVNYSNTHYLIQNLKKIL